VAVSTAGERGVAAPSSAQEAWRLLFGLWTSLRPHLTATLAEEDLTPMQAMTLSVLDPDEPRPMGDLARVLACDNSNVTGIVDRLEERGLLERRPAPGDRRVKMLALTQEGAAVRARHRARLFDPPAAIRHLSEDDQRALCEILARALASSSDELRR
jgi:DNA-binding MarR family transcriptional regulator